MLKNTASQKIGAQMVSATDGSAFTGSVTVAVTVDAGTQATGSVGSGACTHEGNGYHTYAPAQAETNGDLLAFTFTGSGAIPVTVQVYTLAGDAFTRLGAPAGASVSVDVAAIKAETATILGDTNDIQTRIPTALTVDGNIKADALRLGGTLQTGRDVGASVLLSAGTGTGQLDFTSGVVKSNLAQILGTALTETAGFLAAGFKKFFNVSATPSSTMDVLARVTLTDTVTTYTGNTVQTGDAFARIGAAGAGLTALGDTRIANLDATISSRTKPADTQAAVTTVTNLTNAPTSGDLTATMKTSVTTAATAATPTAAAVTGSVGSVVGAVGSVTGLPTTKLAAHAAAVLAAVIGNGSTTTAVKLSTVEGGAPSSTNDFYNGRVIVFTSGALAGQATSISDYDGATTTATVVALTAGAVNGVTAVIV